MAPSSEKTWQRVQPQRYTKSRYIKVGVCIWSDDRFRKLSPIKPSGQSLWLYLITCPSAESIPGLIPMGRMALAEALDWSLEDFDSAFAEISQAGIAEADWKARMVWIPKAIYHNPPGNVNILKHWFAELEKVPETALKTKALTALQAYCERSGEAFAKAFREAFDKGFQEALPKAFANTNSNSNSQQQGAAVVELPEEKPSRRDLFKLLTPPPLVIDKLGQFTGQVLADAWSVGQQFAKLNPDARRTYDTVAKIVNSFASHVSAHGAQGLHAYFSLTDPDQWQKEVTQGKRLPVGASPWEVCEFLSPKGKRRPVDPSPRLQDAGDIFAQKQREYEAQLKAEQTTTEEDR